MKKLLSTLVVTFSITGLLSSQNVAINTSGAVADPSSMLDVSSGTTGILVPRIALTARNVAAPVTAPVNSLLVYNTATAGTLTNAVTPGYYYWNTPTLTWVRLFNTGDAWQTTGNYLTADGILGSLTNYNMLIATNNTARGAVVTTGEMFLNPALTYFVGDVFSSYATGANTAVNGYLSGTGAGNAGYFQSTTSGAGTVVYAITNTVNTGSAVADFEVLAGGTGWNIYALSPTANTRPVIAGNTATLTSTAVVGTVNGAGTMVTLVGGSAGAFTHPTTGVYSTASAGTSTGGIFAGQGATVASLVGGSGVSANGTTMGVYGTASTGGVSTGGGFASNGTTLNTLAGSGSGVAGTGNTVGVYGQATGAGNNTWGGYFANTSANGYAYVGGRTGGTDYKINGPGTVATMVSDLNGNYVNMFCPESPEILFQDFGTGTLVNGKIHIELDPIFTKNITVNEEHPLRVIVQLEGDCQGVFVSNKTANGFDVQELNGGNSNVSFTWFVSANRADRLDVNGDVDSKHTDVRFPVSPLKQQVIVNGVEVKTTDEMKRENNSSIKTNEIKLNRE